MQPTSREPLRIAPSGAAFGDKILEGLREKVAKPLKSSFEVFDIPCCRARREVSRGIRVVPVVEC